MNTETESKVKYTCRENFWIALFATILFHMSKTCGLPEWMLVMTYTITGLYVIGYLMAIFISGSGPLSAAFKTAYLDQEPEVLYKILLARTFGPIEFFILVMGVLFISQYHILSMGIFAVLFSKRLLKVSIDRVILEYMTQNKLKFKEIRRQHLEKEFGIIKAEKAGDE
jgi:hypothetical protein